MQNNYAKNYAILVAVLLLIVVIVLLMQNSKNNPLVSTDMNSVNLGSTTQQVSTSTDTSATKLSVTTQKSSTGVILVPVSPKNISYTEYTNKLGAATMKCTNAATAQYNQSFKGLYSNESFHPYFNQVTGGCFMSIVGVSQKAYATTTTGVKFLRDVYFNKQLAQCIDPKGNTNSYTDWQCTDNVAGQTIQYVQYEDLITKYTTH